MALSNTGNKNRRIKGKYLVVSLLLVSASGIDRANSSMLISFWWKKMKEHTPHDTLHTPPQHLIHYHATTHHVKPRSTQYHLRQSITKSVFCSPSSKLFVIYRTTPWSPHKNSWYLHVLKWILYGMYYYGTMNDKTVFKSMFRIRYFPPNLTFHAKTVKICSFFLNSSTFAMKIRPRKSVLYYILYLHHTSFLLDNVLSFRVGSGSGITLR